jgi:hypothetical protein
MMNARMTFVILARSDMQALFRLPIWQLGPGFLHRRNRLTLDLNRQRAEPLVELRASLA